MNQLASLPAELGNLASLKYLTLSFTNVTEDDPTIKILAQRGTEVVF